MLLTTTGQNAERQGKCRGWEATEVITVCVCGVCAVMYML